MAEFNIYTENRVEIDPDRVEEYVEANFHETDHVKVTTKHGDDVLVRGDSISYECPVCGEEGPLIKGFGDDREYVHIGSDRTCTKETATDTGDKSD